MGILSRARALRSAEGSMPSDGSDAKRAHSSCRVHCFTVSDDKGKVFQRTVCGPSRPLGQSAIGLEDELPWISTEFRRCSCSFLLCDRRIFCWVWPKPSGEQHSKSGICCTSGQIGFRHPACAGQSIWLRKRVFFILPSAYARVGSRI